MPTVHYRVLRGFQNIQAPYPKIAQDLNWHLTTMMSMSIVHHGFSRRIHFSGTSRTGPDPGSWIRLVTAPVPEIPALEQWILEVFLSRKIAEPMTFKFSCSLDAPWDHPCC
ncbi:hypothetical protein V3481_008495 [Fusarium oxysporum f. sp. vasinfectum]